MHDIEDCPYGSLGFREVASPVHDPSSPEVASLVKSMIETMEDVGAGLTAPQVHVSLRIVIFHVPPQAW